jgi:hypothetical protein
MRRPVRSWPILWTAVALTAGAISLAAQEPPRTLPPSITGAKPPTPPPVSPASGVQTQPTAASPAARFQNLQAFPPETVRAFYSASAGANWLSRMNQASGRFLPGLDPTLRTPLATDHDLRQAFAARALAEAARFTGQEEFAARSTQAVLALLSRTRPDPADPARRVPDAPSKECNRVGFAAVLVLAVYALPTPDAKLTAQAEELCAFLRSRVGPDGSIQTADQTSEPAQADVDAVNVYPGLAIQALAASHRAKPDPGKQATLAKTVGHYRGVFKAQPTAMLAATLLPGVADFCLQTRDATAAAAVAEMADHLCGCQYTRSDARSAAWVGGFRSGPAAAEPGAEGALCAAALVSAVQITRQVAPDLARFQRYRQAAVDGLAFARRLQFSDGNADHFEKGFRARFLDGGVHLTPTDGTLRIDATAHLVAAQLAFLQSGAETTPE